MTSIEFRRDDRGYVTAFRSEGHSGYAASGEDIVCAAISALLQSAVFTLCTIYDPLPQYSIEKGFLHCALPSYDEALQPEIQALMRHTMLGLMNIAIGQPRYVRLKVEGITDWRSAFQAEDVSLALRRLLVVPLA